MDAVETAGHLGIPRAVNDHCDSAGIRLNYEVVGRVVAAVPVQPPSGRALEGRE